MSPTQNFSIPNLYCAESKYSIFFIQKKQHLSLDKSYLLISYLLTPYPFLSPYPLSLIPYPLLLTPCFLRSYALALLRSYVLTKLSQTQEHGRPFPRMRYFYPIKKYG